MAKAKVRIIDPEEIEKRVAQAKTSREASKSPTDRAVEALKNFNDITMIGIPSELLRRLHSEAARRNMTFAELLGRALEEYLKRTEPDAGPPVRAVSEK